MANIKQTVDLTQGTFNNLVVVNNKLQLPSVAAPTFTRDSIAYKSDGTQVAANLPRFEPGKFGKAIMVEEGTTNLFTNPKLLNNGQGWTQSSVTAWVDSSGEYPYIHCEAEWDGVYQTLSLSATTYTLTYLVKHKAGSNTIGSHFDGPLSLKIRVDSGAWVENSNIITVPSDGNWHLVEIQATYTTAGYYRVYLQLGRGVVGVSEFWFKYAQLEQKPYATSFIDGTRSPETLTIPTAGILNPQEGTVEIILTPITSPTTNIHFEANTSITNKDQIFIWNEEGVWRAGVWDSSVIRRSIDKTYDGQIGQFKYLALTWKNINSGKANAELVFFVDGVRVGAITGVAINCLQPTLASIGRRLRSAKYWGNALYDDLRISNRARTDAEILAAYQSGQPLPVDEWTTYLLRFDDNLNYGQGGYYISPEYDVSSVNKAARGKVYWQEDADGIQRIVYAKLDNQADWTQVTNGGLLPISAGDVLTNRKLQLKVKMLKVI